MFGALNFIFLHRHKPSRDETIMWMKVFLDVDSSKVYRWSCTEASKFLRPRDGAPLSGEVMVDRSVWDQRRSGTVRLQPRKSSIEYRQMVLEVINALFFEATLGGRWRYILCCNASWSKSPHNMLTGVSRQRLEVSLAVILIERSFPPRFFSCGRNFFFEATFWDRGISIICLWPGTFRWDCSVTTLWLF